MITFADLLSLLLAFFVLLFATTSVQQKDWRRVVMPISEYLTGRRVASPDIVLPATTGKPAHDIGYVAALLDTLITQSPALKGARVERQDRELILTLPPGIMASGGDQPPLADLARLLSNLDNRVDVQVHRSTDPNPAAWQRALADALRTADVIAKSGVDRPIAASGSADLSGDADAERIELVIHDSAATEDSRAAP